MEKKTTCKTLYLIFDLRWIFLQVQLAQKQGLAFTNSGIITVFKGPVQTWHYINSCDYLWLALTSLHYVQINKHITSHEQAQCFLHKDIRIFVQSMRRIYKKA